jgi:hypothetical protein
MARGRMLSRSLGCSRRFTSLPDVLDDLLVEFAQLLFVMIIPHVDDYGRMTADPRSIKLSVLPASTRPEADFTRALEALHAVALITVYTDEGENVLQVNKFEDHQRGLNKRTVSHIAPPPENSREFPRNPGISQSRARAELNRREGNRTELKRREGNRTQGSTIELVREGSPHTTSAENLPPAPQTQKHDNGHTTTARSKRPIFAGQRLTVFEWMFDDCVKTLGPLTEAFHLDEWFGALDAALVNAAIVLQKRDGGAWLQAQLVAEAERRGLPIAVAPPPPSKRSAQLAHTVATIAREEAEKRARHDH